MTPSLRRPLVLLAVLGIVAAGTASRLRAHDIPGDITVRSFIKPEGDRLRVLIRVPMASIHDINWPLRSADGTLDMPRLERPLREAVDVWILGSVAMFEGARKLDDPRVTSVRLSLEGDPFASYDTALATVTGPRLADDARLMATQGMLDMLLEYSIQSDRSRFSFHPRFERFGLRVLTILRYEPPERDARAFEYDRGDPGLVRLDPTWSQAIWNFGATGFRHILGGTDHLLFLLCLVIPARRVLTLVSIVTGFTVAHSVTLIASAYNMAPGALWFPPLIDTLIATSIVYLAVENIVVAAPRRRWIVAFAFGLAHGFGFAFAFSSELQFAGSHLLSSLLAFNLGIEAGQVVMVAVMIAGLALLLRLVPERGATIVLSGIAGHTAWHWMLDRYARFSRYQFEWPVVDAAFLANLLRWLMVMVAIAFAAWVITLLRGKPKEADVTSQGSLS